jgi:hypothetical protein
MSAPPCKNPSCALLIPVTPDRLGASYCSDRCRTAAAKLRSRSAAVCQNPSCAREVAGSADFCSDDCVITYARARGMVCQARAASSAAQALRTPTRSPELDDFIRSGWAAKLDSQAATQAQVAQALATSEANVSRWYQAHKQEQAARKDASRFKLNSEAASLLDDFPAFRSRCFKVPDVRGHVLQGLPYLTPGFQRNWGEAIEDILADPGILLILAPPRHGKSEFLAHHLTWRIVKNPNLRALWVGGNEDIAKQSVGQVRDELANNASLRELFLPPGAAFRPQGRSGLDWSSQKFTVATRSITGIKSATLTAIGKGGKILSRDADLIVVDDIVDHASSLTEGSRDQDWRWFRTQLMSRREPHTAVVIIGSRQHFADIYSHLLADERVARIVDTAHDEASCKGEPHGDCLLFPAMRGYDWLEQQEHSLGRELFEMVYLNRPRAEGEALFTLEPIRACYNFSRTLGDIPPDTRLIGGLDPATRGFQAGFCWAYNPATQKRFMVDLSNRRGAGIAGALELFKHWYALYKLTVWVVEANAFQSSIIQDKEIREWAATHGVTIRPHYTHAGNKWDHNMGVSSLARLFDLSLIDLPYGNEAARKATEAYTRQLLAFESGPLRRAKSDLVMASWFPEPTLRTWRTDYITQASVQRDPAYPWDASTWYKPLVVA